MYIAVEFQKSRFANGSEFRDWAGKQMRLPCVFFHHQEGGKPINGVTPFRWGTSSEGRGRIYAIGAAASHLTMTHWQDFLITGAAPLLKPGICAMTIAPRLHRWKVQQMIFDGGKMRGLHKKLLADQVTRAEIDKHAEGVLHKGIATQLKMLGQDAPDDLMIGDVSVEIDMSRAIDLHGRYVYAAPVSFRTNADFVGPWHVGPLISRGFGRLSRHYNSSNNTIQC